MENSLYNNVRSFGAVGDGVTKDTEAVQRALDAGGIAFFPPGTYLCGTLYLRSNGGIELAAGATLLASPDKEDYNADDFCVQNIVHKGDWATGAHFIVAVEQKNIVLRGNGTIDGNRPAFFEPPKEMRRIWYDPIAWRPGQMIFLCECENVTVTDLNMVNYPYWCLFLHGCDKATIRGLKITNDRFVRNSDGIDLDMCSNVVVSDCIVLTGDDCITLRAVQGRLKKPRKCEHITVTNCVFSSICNAIRVGVGSGEIRDALFSNLVIYDTAKALNIISSYGTAGVLVDGITFSNIRMECGRAFAVLTNAKGRRCGPANNPIRNLLFEHIRGSACLGSSIIGYANEDVNSIEFNDVKLEMFDIEQNPTYWEYICGHPQHTPDPEMGYYEWMRVPPNDMMELWPHRELGEYDTRRLKELLAILQYACVPYEALHIEHASHIALNNVQFTWKGETPDFKNDLAIIDAPNVEINACKFEKGIVTEPSN